MAFAPDALFPLGGYPGDEDKARELFGKLEPAKTREDIVAAAGWLKARPEVKGKIGAVGFCWGGSTLAGTVRVAGLTLDRGLGLGRPGGRRAQRDLRSFPWTANGPSLSARS